MADSDGEFHADDASDDLEDHRVTTSSKHDTRSRSRPEKAKKGTRKSGKAAWEDIQRSWDAVVEDADGSLTAAIEGRAEAEKRARLLRDTTPLQRGIIRHLVLVVDMSFAMLEKDMLPSRYELTIAYASQFVREYFEQNPISQLAVVGMRDGVAIRISDMSGNPAEHLEKLQGWVKQEPQGNPSLQNALEMCRGALFHTPSHGTREVVIIYGALMSSDPGDIHETITSLVHDRIRVSIVGLAAQVAICDELCTKTNGGDTSSYTIAIDEDHFRSLLLEVTTPPVTRTQEQSNASLLMMGFPSRTLAAGDSIHYCSCHNRPTKEGYKCTRCKSRVCRLPAECPGCGLTLILSTHLARSYHHLFPLRNWVDVPWAEAKRSKACYSCLTAFPEVPRTESGKGKTPEKGKGKNNSGSVPTPLKGLSESGRYACEVCRNHFCIDCDLFAHEVLHNCPGCQSDTRGAQRQNGKATSNGDANGAMEIDS
ncbi:TFIIH basal transcription factor complex, subunit SSL1 [Annulohypoxylon maeteangense]|uniref:TFIIH basal transcription factor complex, subunit SSL1 n=1 Tax=Annulohypoxylon maeteangense TaxID=1927788 RepID=UPI0020076DA4|nr:TFIIH basal transcription factor complex, subunit SSL1 [Annulohypoxylon maeteangense]KAI0882438.1 TFIIH basal transcription factor complex, subunit SSL1 [Annulohypoxylon maeteangense]